MKFDLCIGGGEVFLELATGEERDKVWSGLSSSYGWQAEWAEQRGVRQIVISPDRIPIAYRWKCVFEQKIESDEKLSDKDHAPNTCKLCYGRRFIDVLNRRNDGVIERLQKLCPGCSGTGKR